MQGRQEHVHAPVIEPGDNPKLEYRDPKADIQKHNSNPYMQGLQEHVQAQLPQFPAQGEHPPGNHQGDLVSDPKL